MKKTSISAHCTLTYSVESLILLVTTSSTRSLLGSPGVVLAAERAKDLIVLVQCLLQYRVAEKLKAPLPL